MASARQELTAKINDDLTAESRSRLELVVKVGAMEASALTETQARVEGDRAVAQQVTDLSASIAGQLASFDQRIFALVQNEDLIVAGLTTTVSAVRGLGEDAASAAESALNALLTGDRSRRDAAGALAAAREEVTAKVNADIDAVVQRVTAVLVRMGAAEASIVAEELARVTANLAIVSQISQINASVEKNAADIFSEALARADAIGAQASRIDGITARLGEAGTAGAIEALISAAASAYVQPLAAQAGRLDTVEARIGVPDTPGSIEARIDSARNAYVGPLGAQAQRIDGVQATLNGHTASIQENSIAVADALGKLGAFWRVTAIGSGGEAYVELASAEGQTMFVVSPNARFLGDAFFDGTVSFSKINYGTFVRRAIARGVTGSPAAGQTLTLSNQNLGLCQGLGSYTITVEATFVQNVGDITSSYSGKPYYIHNLPDGGLRVRLVKSGVTVAQMDWTTDGLFTGTSRTTFVLNAGRIFEVDDDVAGNVSMVIEAIRGGQDSGIVNQGDYYERNVSAVYSNFNVTATGKWSFV
jgi:hypothetical protein